MREAVIAGRALRAVAGLALTPGMGYAEAQRILRAVEDVPIDCDMERLRAPAKLRHGYIQAFGFSIITSEELSALQRMLHGKRLLEVGAGSGYISRLLADSGADVTASEMGGWSSYGEAGANPYRRDHEGDSVGMVSSEFDAVLMAWPPLGKQFAAEVARRMSSGQTLFHLGEGAGGCTGNATFYEELADGSKWVRMEQECEDLNAAHLCFDGIRDHWRVFRRL
jgi:hypothetical protein